MKKITPETKIKDIIPEGYELNKTHDSFKQNNNNKLIIIEFKKKEKKNFEWYVLKYMKCTYFSLFPECKDIYYQYRSEFMKGEYLNIPFEIRIGLLKFICDKNKQSFMNVFGYLYYDKDYWTNDLLKICPEKFLNSLI